MQYDVPMDLLQRFEHDLDPRHPEAGRIPARILGYGEISTVFEIQGEGLAGLALKRLPIFRTRGEMERYEAVFGEYNRLLTQEVGLDVPGRNGVAVTGRSGRPIFYIIQKQLPSTSIGNRAIHSLPPEPVCALVRQVLHELRRVWDFNRRQAHVRIGIDGQVSNWAIEAFDPTAPRIDDHTRLWYVDTSTPLFRLDGVEQLDPELFLRSAPSFLAWVLRLFFLQDVLSRYYDFRRVVIDLIANFYKEQRPDLVPDLVAVANDFFAHEAPDLALGPIVESEVRSYYREDALIWSLYLSMRKVDRALRTRLLRGDYPYILPEKIKR